VFHALPERVLGSGAQNDRLVAGVDYRRDTRSGTSTLVIPLGLSTKSYVDFAIGSRPRCAGLEKTQAPGDWNAPRRELDHLARPQRRPGSVGLSVLGGIREAVGSEQPLESR
jgi:hypothetical protein